MMRGMVCAAVVIGAWLLPRAESATPAMKRAAHAAAMQRQMRQHQVAAQQLTGQRRTQQMQQLWLTRQSQRNRGQGRSTASAGQRASHAARPALGSPAAFFSRNSGVASRGSTGWRMPSGQSLTSPAALAQLSRSASRIAGMQGLGMNSSSGKARQTATPTLTRLTSTPTRRGATNPQTAALSRVTSAKAAAGLKGTGSGRRSGTGAIASMGSLPSSFMLGDSSQTGRSRNGKSASRRAGQNATTSLANGMTNSGLMSGLGQTTMIGDSSSQDTAGNQSTTTGSDTRGRRYSRGMSQATQTGLNSTCSQGSSQDRTCGLGMTGSPGNGLRISLVLNLSISLSTPP
ncbi:MAG: hypothetical protein FJ271_10920 [Planctomycetes bacterium]|nr:hypothetical protein [Planctomycetota bacterium]